MPRFFLLVAIAATIALAIACGSSNEPPAGQPSADASMDTTSDLDAGDEAIASDAAPDVDYGAASDAYPAFRPPVPQIVSAGAAVMATARIVPVFFSGDALQAQIVDFLQKYAAAPHWTTAVHEYGVGALSIATPVVLPVAPSRITDTQIQLMLSADLDGTHAEWGPVDTATFATSIYVVFFPGGTSVIDDRAMPPITTCAPGAFYAYHAETPRFGPSLDGGTDAAIEGGTDAAIEAGSDAGRSPDDRIIYATMPRCPASGGRSELDQLTSLIIHEITEAATDPIWDTSPAYNWLDGDHQTWGFTSFGGEVGDMCQEGPYASSRPADVGYLIQRTWSNASMMGYHDPCVPIPPTNGPFFASVPIEPDAIFVRQGMYQYRVKGVNVAVGHSKTIEVQLLSDGPMPGPWAILPHDYEGYFLGGTPILDLKLDRSRGVNGEKVHLTITPLRQPTTKTAFYYLDSRYGGQAMLWWGAVTIP